MTPLPEECQGEAAYRVRRQVPERDRVLDLWDPVGGRDYRPDDAVDLDGDADAWSVSLKFDRSGGDRPASRSCVTLE